MALKSDWLLQHMGITQWVLRRPEVLRGVALENVSYKVHLLIIAQIFPKYNDLLFCDVLRSLRLTTKQIYLLTPQQVAILPKYTKCHSWRLGIREPLSLCGIQLYSPVLSELSRDSLAKRALWQQICNHEQHFYHNSLPKYSIQDKN